MNRYQLLILSYATGVLVGPVQLRPGPLHLPDVGRHRRQASSEDRVFKRPRRAFRSRLRQHEYRLAMNKLDCSRNEENSITVIKAKQHAHCWSL